MKQKTAQTTEIISVCGLFAALSVVVMLLAHIGVLTYAVPALAGALLVIIYLEFSIKNAFTVFITVSVLSFLICEKEASLCYILFFGYYPLIKAYIERIKSKIAQWVVKVLLFSISFALILVLATVLLGIPLDTMGLGIYYIIGLAVALEIMFVLYDIALTKVITLYLVAYREKFRRMMKLKNSGEDK